MIESNKNAKKMSDEEIKKCLLEILVYFDEMCKKNNIHYFLSSGSCLGAVRHQGFIPWDNDIDVMVPREEYNRIKDVFQLEKSKYKLLSFDTVEDYYYPFYKLVDSETIVNEKTCRKIKEMGLWIDIFPLDKMPNDSNKRRKYKKNVIFLSKLIRIKNIIYTNNYFACFIKRIIGILLNNKKLCYKINAYASKYSNCDFDPIYVMDAVWGHKEFEKKCVLTLSDCLFEGKEYPIPANYSLYLKTIYGEYMKLPPAEQRVFHSIDAYKILIEGKND